MATKATYFDATKVKEMVSEELNFRTSQGVPLKPVIPNFLNQELLYNSDETGQNIKKIRDGRFAPAPVDPMTAFKLQEESKKTLELNKDKENTTILRETNTLLSKLPKYEITKCQLYVKSPKEIREQAVVNVNSLIRESGLNHGLFDKRMGSVSSRELCITCSRDDRGCSGHFGYIKLPEFIVNPMFKKQCIHTLQCICPYCGDTYIDDKIFAALKLHLVPKKKLLKVVAELSEKWLWKLHNHNNAANVIYDKEFHGRRLCFTYANADKPQKYTRSIQNMMKMYNSVPEEKWKLLGYIGETRPINFFTDVIPCAPPRIRTINIVNGKIMDNPLTERYTNVLTSIIRLSQHVGTKIDRENELDNLYAHIESIIYGPEKKIGVKTPLKEAGILLGLGTKKGQIRGNMMGKRVNHSGRTVAGPGFEANVGEVMLPGYATKISLVPVTVHRYNYERVIKNYRNRVYKFIVMKVISSSGSFEIGEEQLKKYTPEIGDILLRFVKTGDRGLCGRQPSLHSASMLAFNYVVHPWSTIKIPNYINHGFNADFDGDELTFHILQNTMAMAEADTIMNSKYHIMNDQSNKPMMALAFHALMGCFLMTKSWLIKGKRSEVIIPDRRWNEVLCVIGDSYRKSSLEQRVIKHGLNPRSGRALFSVVLPTNFSYNGGGLKIIDGVLVQGILKKSNIGLKVLSLVQIIAKMYSIKEACRFINDTQKIADWFMMWHGLSMGYKDFEGNRKEVIKMLKTDVNKMQIELFNLGSRPKDEIPLFFFMRSLHTIVDKTRDNGQKIGGKILKENNRLNILSEDKGCGAKGSLANTSQITGSLGEQFIGSNIPAFLLKGKTRCLPYYVPNDISLESIGYVIHSYMDGINPSDSFFHEMASRITLIDTARNVSEIGYTHRRVEKSLEPIIISWLGLVVSADGRLFQPLFGAGFAIDKILEIQTKRTSKVLYFCNFNDEVHLLSSIYKRKLSEKHGGKKVKIIKADQKKNEYVEFKHKNGRFPKFSEIDEEM